MSSPLSGSNVYVYSSTTHSNRLRDALKRANTSPKLGAASEPTSPVCSPKMGMGKARSLSSSSFSSGSPKVTHGLGSSSLSALPDAALARSEPSSPKSSYMGSPKGSCNVPRLVQSTPGPVTGNQRSPKLHPRPFQPLNFNGSASMASWREYTDDIRNSPKGAMLGSRAPAHWKLTMMMPQARKVGQF
eukprot:TRINITY_DN27951_c0_g1_i1.p2 TRINITY_DN27951_c0_g1~~TRINITY_DN27951_c0_g1_i1.p2  ORF type:complete len:212 (+),score=29.78 TRINITY_DN27951_c0_g1_i1:74-637(+)